MGQMASILAQRGLSTPAAVGSLAHLQAKQLDLFCSPVFQALINRELSFLERDRKRRPALQFDPISRLGFLTEQSSNSCL